MADFLLVRAAFPEQPGSSRAQATAEIPDRAEHQMTAATAARDHRAAACRCLESLWNRPDRKVPPMPSTVLEWQDPEDSTLKCHDLLALPITTGRRERK